MPVMLQRDRGHMVRPVFFEAAFLGGLPLFFSANSALKQKTLNAENAEVSPSARRSQRQTEILEPEYFSVLCQPAISIYNPTGSKAIQRHRCGLVGI
jgi:hypothetical protein